VITREDLIVQSVQDHLKAKLAEYGYPPTRVEMLESFNAELLDEKFPDGLDHTLVAPAFQFDDGGTVIELGSSLTGYTHTIDWLVLGHTPTWGRNVAQVIKQAFFVPDGVIPLRDYRQPIDPRPIIDYLQIDGQSVEREVTFEARSWNQFAWSTRIRVYDEVASAA
jgi:hypothetical protein